MSQYFCHYFALIDIIDFERFINFMEVRILQSENQVYQKEKLLGEGAFGKAYLVKQKQTGQNLVIKEVSIDHMSQKQREETIKQAQILRNFRHPLIVKFIEVYATKQNKLKIVMEFAQSGDLSKAITARKATKKFFQENQILDWFTQICLAMKHVHDRKILHRDIKGQNIFITKANTLKLGDFGIARVLNKTQDKARTVVGTPYYLSPQIIENKPYSFKSDVWSMGVLLYELCALAPPFTATSLQFLALKIVKGSYSGISGTYSSQLKGLVSQMLQLDPNKRPSVSQILKKPFLQDRIRKYLSETYRKEEFSHTILHNQKVQIANKLVKVQAQKGHSRQASGQKDLSEERNRLKEEAAMLKQKMEIKKKEEDQRMRAKREEDRRRRQYEQRKKRQDQDVRRRQREIKQKQLARKRADDARQQWIEEQKRKQLQKQRRDEQLMRVQNIAEMARRRDKEEQRLLDKKERLMQEKYELEQQRNFQDQKMRQKKQQKQKQQRKANQWNQMARQQWHQNNMIRKRAEERARQAQIQAYSSVFPQHQEAKIQERPISNQQRRSKEKYSKPSYDPPKKYSMSQQDPTEEQLQNAMLNPNFGKKTPQSARSRQKNTKNTSASTSNASSNVRSKVKEDPKPTHKKNYDEERQKMRKDREQFLRKKGGAQTSELKPPQQTLKPAKWGKSRSKSRQQSNPPEPIVHQEPKAAKVSEQSLMQSKQLKMNIKDQQQFNDYLDQLQDLLNGVNKNMQKMNNPLPEMEVVEEKILVREDDNEELDYSITGSFMDLKQKDKEIKDDADLDYFSSYDKLEELKIILEDKFGTQNFVQIYRALEDQLNIKGLEGFNILDIVDKMSNIPNSNLIAQNLPLLLTLIVMQQRMSSC